MKQTAPHTIPLRQIPGAGGYTVSIFHPTKETDYQSYLYFPTLKEARYFVARTKPELHVTVLKPVLRRDSQCGKKACPLCKAGR